MSVKETDSFIGLGFVARGGVDAPDHVAEAIDTFFAEVGIRPDRITDAKTHAFSPQSLRTVLADPARTFVIVWVKSAGLTPQCSLYLRDDPKVADYERRWSGAIAPGVRHLPALLGLARQMDARFGILSGGIARYPDRAHAAREVFDGGDREECDPAMVARLDWDSLKWRRTRTKLRRLYPITLIGPEIWAKLPPMPAFDPMPRVEDLGAGKLVTAWPTLCEPRDPAFLRGTRALREWLWPFTIQNPADHVDNDP